MNIIKRANTQKEETKRPVKQATTSPGNYMLHCIDDLTSFQKPYGEAISIAPKKEMPAIMQSACDKCKHQYNSNCEGRCYLYHNYCYWYSWASDGPRVVYVEKAIKQVSVKHHKHQITPKMHCTQVVSSQITKLIKKYNENSALMLMKEETKNKTKNGAISVSGLTKIREIAKNNGFDNIVNTIDKFINGKSSTEKTGNK